MSLIDFLAEPLLSVNFTPCPQLHFTDTTSATCFKDIIIDLLHAGQLMLIFCLLTSIMATFFFCCKVIDLLDEVKYFHPMLLNTQQLHFFLIGKQSNQLECFHRLIFPIFSSRLTTILYQNFVDFSLGYLFKVVYYSLFVLILFIVLMIKFNKCYFLFCFKVSIN